MADSSDSDSSISSTDSTMSVLTFNNVKNYEEFRLQVKLCKMITNHNNGNFGDFIDKLCTCLEKFSQLQLFKNSFIKTLLGLDLSDEVIAEINKIGFDNVETQNKLDNLNADLFVYITDFLQMEDMVNLQYVNLNLLDLCFNPLCYKNKLLEWTKHRYYFGQNLSHWRFDRIRILNITAEAESEDNGIQFPVKLYRDVIDSNINLNWFKSVETFELEVFSHCSVEEEELLSKLKLFENVSNATIIHQEEAHNIFRYNINQQKLEKLKYSGYIIADVLKDLANCKKLKQLEFECCSLIKLRLFDCDKIENIVQTLQCQQIQSITIDETHAFESDEMTISFYEFIHAMIIRSNNQIDLDITFSNKLGMDCIKQVFDDKNIALKLSSLNTYAHDVECIGLMKLFSESMIHCLNVDEKMKLIEICMWNFGIAMGDEIIQTAQYMHTMVTRCEAVKIILQKLSLNSAFVLLQELKSMCMLKTIKYGKLGLRVTIASDDIDQERSSILELLSYLQENISTFSVYCQYLIIEIVNTDKEQWNDEEWKQHCGTLLNIDYKPRGYMLGKSFSLNCS